MSKDSTVSISDGVSTLLSELEIELGCSRPLTVDDLSVILRDDFYSEAPYARRLIGNCTSLTLRYLVVWSKDIMYRNSSLSNFTVLLLDELEEISRLA